MISYLDFEAINLKDADVRAEAFLNLQQTIPSNTFNKMAISKIDIDVGDNFYFQRVPLENPQSFYDDADGDFFPEYATAADPTVGLVDDDNNLFNQTNGWFQTKYKMIISYLDGSNHIKLEEFPILFKSDEIKFNYSSIGKKLTDTPGDYIYDNFNDYFISYNPNNILNSFNTCIRIILCDRLNISDLQYAYLLPKFHTDDKKLFVDNLSFGYNNDLQNKNPTLPLQVEWPEQVDPNNFTYPGSHTNKLFAIGFNKIVNGLLYHGLETKYYSPDDLVALDANFTTTEEYYFLKLEQILNVALSIPENATTPTAYYNISTQYVNEFYDLGDIKLIVIKGNLPVLPLYCIIKNKDYLLSAKQEGSLDTMAQNVLFKLSINNNTLCPTRFIFQQPSITNNYSSLIGGLNNTNYQINIEYIDKYNNSYDALLSYGDKIYVQLAAFN